MGKGKKKTREGGKTILSKLFRYVEEDKVQRSFLSEDHASSFLLKYPIDLEKIKRAPQVD